MYKAIITKYHGPGNVRGARISATDDDGNSVTIPYPYEELGERAHFLAAQALCDKMGWRGVLHGGALKNAYVFVWSSHTREDGCTFPVDGYQV